MSFIISLVNWRHQTKSWLEQQDIFTKKNQKHKKFSSYSKPFFSKEDYEKEAQSNPDNLYIQRQLGRHYEANKQYEAAKEVYLRQVAKKSR